MTANIKVPSLNVLNGLQNHKNGEIAYVVATDAYYRYNDDEGWVEQNPGLTVYDLNKQVVNQFANFTENEIIKAKEVIKEWKKGKGPTLLLFGKELAFINIFTKQMLAADNLEDVLIKILTNRFTGIKNIIIEDDDTLGIWVDEDGEPTYMRLMEWEVNIYNG